MERNDKMLGFDFEPEAVILGGGDFPSHRIPTGLLKNCSRIVCCDGASNQCIGRGISPWRIVGDGDSISEETRSKFGDIICTVPEQETNDQTKAVNFLVEHGCRRIAIVGATGRREDHTLGNISLLMEYMHQGIDVRIYTDYGVFIACKDDESFCCPRGTAVSIFGFGTKGMKSEGLAYQLYDFNTWWQGTLNHTVEDSFSISCRGDYLVFLNYENKKIRE